jgi:protein involved in polysaccharide export with SLBB domain
MTLADLVALAGGLLPNAVGKAEVAGAWQSVDAKPEQVPFAGDTGSYVVPGFGLKPGDTVLIAERSDIVRRPPIVTILGAVKNPGAYAINGRGEKLADLLARANGFTEEAFPQGAEYIRNPKYISTDLSKRLVPRVAEVMQQVADENYKRISQLIDLEKLRILFTKGATVSIPFNPRPVAPSNPAAANPPAAAQTGQGADGGAAQASPDATDPVMTLDNSLANLLQSNSSTPARRLTEKDLIPAGNLNIRVDRAMSNPRSLDNVELKDGDVILIPVRPTSVSVVGAVALPSAILHVPGKDPGYYIERSGWFTGDADRLGVLVIRATGELLRYRRGMRTEVGDVIFVPTKVQALRLRDSGESLANTVQTFTSAASTLAILRSLGR